MATMEDGTMSLGHGSIEYQTKLNLIYQRIHEADHFEDIIWELEQDVLDLMQAERLTIYRKDGQTGEIISWYRTSGDDMEEIRLPISPTSIAGYVAMSHRPILIQDVYDAEALSAIHPQLTFDSSYDHDTGYLTESMVVVPIRHKETLLGVLQVINRQGGGDFSEQDVIHALAIAKVIASKFRYELKSTSGPYDYLIQTKRISLDELDQAEEKARTHGYPISVMLGKMFEVPREELGHSLAQFYQVPFLNFDEQMLVDQELLQALNVTYLAKNYWVPLQTPDGETLILIDNPNDSDKLMEIQHLLGAQTFEIRVGLQEDILRYLGYELAALEDEEEEVDLEQIVEQLQEESLIEVTSEFERDSDELLDENSSAIVNLVNRLIVDAVEMNASDIHVEPRRDESAGVVRMRVDGVCREVLSIPAQNMRAVVARIKILSKLDIAERRKPQDGKISVKMSGRPLELRVATLPTVNGESAVMRVLAAGEPLPFEKLNLTARNEESAQRMLAHPHGIILVVGPTGSGKTTTLHAWLGFINKPDRKILTAEDPVEITQPGLQQVQVHSRIGLTFATALRAFLRCDPDVILIGEMRDHETAHSGIEASLTGHLVFSTLHTNSAPETVVRLLDMGLDPMNFSDAFVGVLAQRLVRTLCKDCKEPYTPSAEEMARLSHYYGENYFPELNIDPRTAQICRPVGCPKCGQTGYRGRTGVHELMEATDALKKLVAKRSTVEEIRVQAMKDGMRTILQDGVYKIFKGDTNLEQLLRVTAG